MKFSILQKRLAFICVLICFSLGVYGIITMRRVPNQVAKVNALPITNKVVVIDAGHGLPDERIHLLTPYE